MSAEYVIWRTNPGQKYCVLGGLFNAPAAKNVVTRGRSVANGFPKDAHFKMSPEFPKDVALSDALENSRDMAVVSSPLKDFILERSPPSMETLPVRVLNLKGKDVGAQFWILNPLAIVDCIDQDASQVIWNAIDKTEICGFKKFVINAKAIPRELLLLRPKYLEPVVFVRRDLADAILAKGFTGIYFAELDTFMG